MSIASVSVGVEVVKSMTRVGEVHGRLLYGGGLLVDAGDALQVVLKLPSLPAP
jgi:hypothetical protein